LAGSFFVAVLLAAGLDEGFFATAFLAGAFFAAGRFFGAGLAGIGMDIPPCPACWAAAGADNIASAPALTAANNLLLTAMAGLNGTP
jgi:hypothetical protein